MRIDRASITLTPRTLTGCLDLGAMFFGRHLGTILLLWLSFAVPCCALVFALSYWWGFDMRIVPVVTLFATGPYGVLLISGATQAAFGDRLSFATLWSGVTGRIANAVFINLLMRGIIALGPVLWLYPQHWPLIVVGIVLTLALSFWPAIRTGFLAEQAALKRLEGHLADRKIGELIRLESGELILRGTGILAFCCGVWFVLFLTWDAFSGLLCLPSLTWRFVRMSQMFELEEFALELLFADPWVMAEVTALILLVYPLGRLAWFFCYIDLRVRRDLWDMELLLTCEAARLREEHGSAADREGSATPAVPAADPSRTMGKRVS